ncbi:MAG: phospho-sugar mutase, partial [Spirochaetaceae bacterium]|nr:phospho-sugar mutase [Spirochaetaceae bacterium]
KDVLTGFKYIAEQIKALEGNKDKYFIFGCEESYGFLTVPFVRDKDAVSSCVAAVEMMSYYQSKGVTLIDRLNEIYKIYGYSTEVGFARDYEGASGKEEMDRIMKNIHTIKVSDVLVNREVVRVEDLLGENTGFPKADVVIIYFKSGEKLVVRPSGTEPKIKYYVFLSGEREEITASLSSIVEEFKSSL